MCVQSDFIGVFLYYNFYDSINVKKSCPFFFWNITHEKNSIFHIYLVIPIHNENLFLHSVQIFYVRRGDRNIWFCVRVNTSVFPIKDTTVLFLQG